MLGDPNDGRSTARAEAILRAQQAGLGLSPRGKSGAVRCTVEASAEVLDTDDGVIDIDERVAQISYRKVVSSPNWRSVIAGNYRVASPA